MCIRSTPFVLCLGISMLSTPLMAEPIKDLLSVYQDLNEMCRGWSGDDPHTAQACKVRDKVSKMLAGTGYCYGKKGQAGYQMQWHRCTKGSLR